MTPEEIYAIARGLVSFADSDPVDEYLAAERDPDLRVQPDADTPLRPMLAVAALHGKWDMVRTLLAAGAGVDMRGDDGFTALMHAAQHGHKAVAATLLGAGADRTITSPDGKTAAALAADPALRALIERTDDDDGDGDDDDDDDDGRPPLPTELTVAALERFYARPLPEAFRAFIATGTYTRYEGKTFPMPTYSGGIEVRFAGRYDDGTLEVPDLLRENAEDAEHAALVPLGAIYLNATHRDAQFVLVDGSKPGCPVVMFEHESNEFLEVADSLAEFLDSAV